MKKASESGRFSDMFRMPICAVPYEDGDGTELIQ